MDTSPQGSEHGRLSNLSVTKRGFQEEKEVEENETDNPKLTSLVARSRLHAERDREITKINILGFLFTRSTRIKRVSMKTLSMSTSI